MHGKRTEGKRAKKELIERTALRLFAERGIAETTIRDIASAAGIAEGTMYRHFDSKDDLAKELFVENYKKVGRELREIQKSKPTAKAKIGAMVAHYCGEFERDVDMVSYLFNARHSQMQHLTKRMDNPYLVFRSVIRAGMARGEIPEQNPDVAASMVMGVILQVIDSRLMAGRIKGRISDQAETITRACWRVLDI